MFLIPNSLVAQRIVVCTSLRVVEASCSHGSVKAWECFVGADIDVCVCVCVCVFYENVEVGAIVDN